MVGGWGWGEAKWWRRGVKLSGRGWGEAKWWGEG